MTELRLFGALSLVRDDGVSIQSVVAQPRRAALLAYLAAAEPQGAQPRDHLLAMFWPESTDERARNALKQAVFVLRRSLGEGVIRNEGAELLGLDPGLLWCDVVAFRCALEQGRLEEALELYRGDLLEGFHTSDAPGFERWVEEERSRLRSRAAEAAAQLSTVAEQHGEEVAALRWARRAHELAPDEEALLRRVLVLLAGKGERAEALRTYEAFAARLAAEYELEPSAETRALVAEIRAPEVIPARPAPRPPRAESAAPLAEDDTQAVDSSEPARVSVVSAGSAGGGWRVVTRRWWLWIGVLVLGAPLAARSMDLSLRTPPIRQQAGLAILEDDRVLVAAFENRTGDPSLDVLGDMAADWAAQGLQQTGLVRVIDPVSALLASRAVSADSMPPTGPTRIAALGRASSAGIVISGAIYRQRDSLLFRTQITDAKRGQLLHALEPVSAAASDPVSGVERLQSLVAGAVATLRDQRLASLSAASSRPPNLEAYQAYVRGLEYFQHNQYAEAIPYFEVAAQADSTFFLPHFWLAFAYGNSGQREQSRAVIRAIAGKRSRMRPLDQYALDFFLAAEKEDHQAAAEATRAAARLSPGSNWSYLAGIDALWRHRFREGVAWLEQVDPQHGWARGWSSYWLLYLYALHCIGDYERGLEMARLARALVGDDIWFVRHEVSNLVALGRVEEAQATAAAGTRLPQQYVAHWRVEPGFALVGLGLEFRTHGYSAEAQQAFSRAVEWYRSQPLSSDSVHRRQHLHGFADALYQAGQTEEAKALYLRLRSEYGGDQPLESPAYAWWLGKIAVRLADTAEVARSVSILERHRADPDIPPMVHEGLARIAALQGKRDQAVEYLRELRARGRRIGGYYNLCNLLHQDEDFAPLRGYPPAEALVWEDR